MGDGDTANGHRYAAFISYSSRDAAFARRLHRALETYNIPTILGAFQFADSGKKNRVYPIFRDRDELPAGELGPAIESALRASGALIVICSPHAAASEWVDREISFFLQNGRKDRVFAVIAEDAPLEVEGRDATFACFPKSFRGDFEPIAADARKGKDGFRAAWLKIVAGMCNLNAGALADRDAKRRRANRIALAASSAAALALIIAASLWGVTQNNISVQAGRLVQEAIRRDDGILAALAIAAPMPSFSVDAQPAREALATREDLLRVNAAELRASQRVGLSNMAFKDGLHTLAPNLSVTPMPSNEIIDLDSSSCAPLGIAAENCRTGPSFYAEGRLLEIAEFNDRVEIRDPAQPVHSIWSRTFDQAFAALPAVSAAPQAAQGRFGSLFGLSVADSARDAVSPEIWAWAPDAGVLAWAAEGNVFFGSLDAGAPLRAARLPFAVYRLTPLEGNLWFAAGARDARILDVRDEGVTLHPLDAAFDEGGEVVYSRAHHVGVVGRPENLTFFHIANGAVVADKTVSGASNYVEMSPDGEWFSAYGGGVLRFFSVKTMQQVAQVRVIQNTVGAFLSFGVLDGAPIAVVADLDQHTQVVSLAGPPAAGSDLFIRRLCAGASSLADTGATVAAIAPLYHAQFERIAAKCSEYGRQS